MFSAALAWPQVRASSRASLALSRRALTVSNTILPSWMVLAGTMPEGEAKGSDNDQILTQTTERVREIVTATETGGGAKTQ
jgi:hypothetical protein